MIDAAMFDGFSIVNGKLTWPPDSRRSEMPIIVEAVEERRKLNHCVFDDLRRAISLAIGRAISGKVVDTDNLEKEKFLETALLRVFEAVYAANHPTSQSSAPPIGALQFDGVHIFASSNSVRCHDETGISTVAERLRQKSSGTASLLRQICRALTTSIQEKEFDQGLVKFNMSKYKTALKSLNDSEPAEQGDPVYGRAVVICAIEILNTAYKKILT